MYSCVPLTLTNLSRRSHTIYIAAENRVRKRKKVKKELINEQYDDIKMVETYKLILGNTRRCIHIFTFTIEVYIKLFRWNKRKKEKFYFLWKRKILLILSHNLILILWIRCLKGAENFSMSSVEFSEYYRYENGNTISCHFTILWCNLHRL